MIHQFDPSVNPMSAAGAMPWELCPSHTWCHKFSDRYAASLISRRLPHMYRADRPGIVLRPSSVEILCSFASDGNSMGLTCDDESSWPTVNKSSCIPGCWRAGAAEAIDAEWLNPNSTMTRTEYLTDRTRARWCQGTAKWAGWCPWRPTELKSMMEQHEYEIRKEWRDCSAAALADPDVTVYAIDAHALEAPAPA